MNRVRASVAAAALCAAAPAWAQPSSIETLSAELAQARAQIDDQRRTLEAQDARLRALEARLAGATAAPGGEAVPAPGTVSPGEVGTPGVVTQPGGVEQVGEAPEIEMPQVAVLGEQGNIITNAGQLTAESQFEYARSDRNRVLFRGIEIPQSVLIGVFDINESRTDVVTAAQSLRYGITDRLEVGVRVPFIYRSEFSVITPIPGTTPDPSAATIDSSVDRRGLGDLEFLARYQLTPARRGLPFLIGGLQVVVPTGSSPFDAERDSLGRALEGSTGSGFWGVTPSVTAILPSDPAVLFGTLAYTYNFAENVDTTIPPVVIERVDPGEALAASFGIGVSLNQRTSFNLGYAHSWVFGTETRTRLLEPPPNDPGAIETTSRDLQLGRFLFGMTYRVNDATSVNMAFEVGATEDATDLRAVLRIPTIVFTGR